MSEKSLLNLVLQKIRGGEGDIIPILRTIPFFEGLTFTDLKKIELIVHKRIFMPDEIIFHERQPGAGIYIIKKGLVKLTKTVNEEKVKISELKDGEFFGEMSLLDEYPRSAEAKAVEKTETLGIFRPDLFDLIERNPKLGYKILLRLSKRLVSRLRETTEKKLKEIE
jgi:CRP/FNR family transcriptional regulator, cyclic AMP receptor protein